MEEFISRIILGFIQGFTEFLPVSSTGHLILAREFLGFESSFGLAEDAVFHLATALAVLIYFRVDIKKLIRSFFLWIGGGEVESKNKAFILALVLGTAPAVILGLLFEGAIETVFRSSVVVAGGLVLGSLIFLVAEYAGKKVSEKKEITTSKGFLIGLFQALALIPGMSRSGMVISGGLFFGLSRLEAARFGFLLSFPVILGAGLLQFYKLFSVGALPTVGLPLLAGAVVAFLSGMFAIHLLLRFVRSHSLIPFVVYRLLLAALILFVL